MKTFLTNSETAAGVKISGTGITETIDLQTDLLVTNRLVLSGASQRVNIETMTWSGEVGSVISIARNGVNIIKMLGEDFGQIVFSQLGFNESQENASDIVVTLTGEAYIYLGLRKVFGYAQTFEPSVFGSYDNPNVAGV